MAVNDAPERRHDRRHEDRLLIELEGVVRGLKTDVAEVQGLLKANTAEIGRIRMGLGDRFTTLIFDLDERYMPRTEMRREYVPREEHEAAERGRRTWRRQWPAIAIAAAVLGVQVLELIHTLH